MEISITAVTKNRHFTKALARHSAVLDAVRESGGAIVSAEFDILQLVFVDRPPAYASAIGCRGGDRLFQVHVGIPDEKDVDYRNGTAFVRMVADKVMVAAKSSGLPDATQSQLAEKLTTLGMH
jgi:hypothetical protein